MSEIRSIEGPVQAVDRRSVVRRELTTQDKVRATTDWIRTQREKVEKGILTQSQSDELLARSMVASELLTERANNLRKKDPMTGLFNKGYYIEQTKDMVNQGLPFGVLMLDLDHFKKTNDTHGHLVGDVVLTLTAKNIQSNLREIRKNDDQNDMAIRYGGEEFVILLPGVTNESDLEAIGERIRESIGAVPYSVTKEGQPLELPVTVSIGGGVYRQGRERYPTETLPGQERDASNPLGFFFEQIDKQGLYQAKESGRNKTVIIPA